MGQQTSVAQHQIRSLMCAPLPARAGARGKGGSEDGRPLGAVCLVSRRFSTAFNESALRPAGDHVHLASLAVAGALEQQRLKAENASLKGTPALNRLLTSERADEGIARRRAQDRRAADHRAASPARPAPARSWWRAALHESSLAAQRAVRGGELRGDAARRCSRASCSATRRAPSPARSQRRIGKLRAGRTAARCSSTRSAR